MDFLGCDFHSVHGAFKADVESTDKFKTSHKDSKTWREGSVGVIRSNKISLEFCDTGID